MTGTATFMKEKNKNVHAIAIQAQKNHLLQGLRNFEESAIPELFKRRLGVVDEWMTATNKDSFEAVRQLVEKETMLVGPSSGSVMTSMLKVAYNLDHGIIVGIFADDGRKFRSLYIKENVLTEQEYNRALKSAKYISKLAYSS
jgi:cysteine synthase B